jgi:hypothetical protein
MRITPRYSIAFLLLCLLLQELHEAAHLLADRLTINCGTRYFLYWQTCEQGNKYAVAAIAFAGPLTNFIFMSIGFLLLSKRSGTVQRSIGFSLVLACIPLQRLQALVYRGSDEITGFRKLMLPAEPFKGAAVIAGILLMLLFIVPSLYRAFPSIRTKGRWVVMGVFLIIPFLVSYSLQQLLAGEHAREMLLSAPTGFLPSRLVLLDIMLVILFIPFAKSIGQLFSVRPSS